MNARKFDTSFFGHPAGLAILFFTEMWERFSYYGMRGLLVLYIYTSVEDGGLGWSRLEAVGLYGWYTMFVYLMSIPGGILADKYLGQKRTVMLGGALLCLGHGVLAIPGMTAFFGGLTLIVLGVGGLKPNISTMVGGLYQQGDIRRDQGFTIFYIGINVGAFLAGIIVGYIGQTVGWHYGFGLAGIGMVFGQIVFIWGQKYLEGVGDLVKVGTHADQNRPNYFLDLVKQPVPLVVTLILMALGVYVATQQSLGYGLILMSIAPFLGMGINIYNQELSKIERDRVAVLLLSFLIIIIFWGAFEQAGGLMNIYANEKINRVTQTWIIDLLFLLGVLYFAYMGYRKMQSKAEYYHYWLGGAAFLLVLGVSLKFLVFTGSSAEIPASVFQSVNSFFILTCGTAVAAYWANRKRFGRESSSLFKMAIGTIIMGLGFVMMAGASVEASAEPYGKGAMIWLIMAYFLHTIGELCTSPVSLSFVTKLAPAQYASIMMGLYFAATGFGNKLAGLIGESAQPEPIEVHFQMDDEVMAKYSSLKEAVSEDKDFTLNTQIFLDDKKNLVLQDVVVGQEVSPIIQMNDETKNRLKDMLSEESVSPQNPFHTIIRFSKDSEAKKFGANKGDGKDYDGDLLVDELQNRLEFKTFLSITAVTVLFGLVLIIFLRKLKALTHGVEEEERDMVEEKAA